MSKKKFTKYDEDTGEILCIFSSLEEEAHFNAPYIEGEYSPKEYIVVDGVAVERDPSEIEAKEIQKAWSDLRATRNGLLKDSDWTQVPDAPVDQATWAAHQVAARVDVLVN